MAKKPRQSTKSNIIDPTTKTTTLHKNGGDEDDSSQTLVTSSKQQQQPQNNNSSDSNNSKNPQSPPDKKRKLVKRAEQNRTAQKAFRQRKNEYIKSIEMKSNLADSLQFRITCLLEESRNGLLELDRVRSENIALMQERERMIHIMDRLRSDNSTLREQNSKLLKQQQNGGFSTSTSSLGTTPIVSAKRPNTMTTVKGGSGNFGAIFRPPSNQTRFDKVKPFPWTSHSHTFVDQKTTSDENPSTNITGSSSNASPSTTNDNPSTQQNQWGDLNNYPGYPSWTPSQSYVKNDQNWQAPPYHLSFSYTDSAESHFTLPHFTGLEPIMADDGGSLAGFTTPFLPSTNMMLPLLHHIPFETSRKPGHQAYQHHQGMHIGSSNGEGGVVGMDNNANHDGGLDSVFMPIPTNTATISTTGTTMNTLENI